MTATKPGAKPSVVTVGSATQSAEQQAHLLRRAWGVRDVNVLAVTVGSRGFLSALASPSHRWIRSEVADVYGRPVDVNWLFDKHGTAIIDAAQLHTPTPVDADQNIRDVATSYGLGQLVSRARQYGAHTVVIGVATFPGADAGSGAANAAGARLYVADGSGLKVGANELSRCTDVRIEGLIRPASVIVLCDTAQSLNDITTTQDPRRHFAAHVARLAPNVTPEMSYTGAADGLAFGMAALFGATLVDASMFGVRLHDPSYTGEQPRLLVGSEAEIDRFLPAYSTAQAMLTTYPCEQLDAPQVAEIHALAAQLGDERANST